MDADKIARLYALARNPLPPSPPLIFVRQRCLPEMCNALIIHICYLASTRARLFIPLYLSDKHQIAAFEMFINRLLRVGEN